ncbi:MAG: alpha/beta fold hydrolase [Proteobacteria bacterium]|nr:alpha/beta fold hydrolase [Pseudomonadota bacterium]
MDIQVTEHYAPNGEGWQLHLKQICSKSSFDENRHPVIMIPGYGMNTFILGYHPNGTPMEHAFADAGYEVWSVCLRSQGRSLKSRRHPAPPSLKAYAQKDMTVIIDTVFSKTLSKAKKVHLIGCSLGGSVAYAHLALCPDHRVGSIIAIGAPMRWDAVNPLMRLAFSSVSLASLFRFRGTQRFARRFFPLLARVPGALSMYMNTSHIDVSKASVLTKSVDDPHPRLNHDLALWMRHKDMILGGINVTAAMGAIDLPLLIVLANSDGIVPPEAALSAKRAWGGNDVTVLEVGTEEDWYAHADLFIAPEAPQKVFEPIARWMLQTEE